MNLPRASSAQGLVQPGRATVNLLRTRALLAAVSVVWLSGCATKTHAVSGSLDHRARLSKIAGRGSCWSPVTAWYRITAGGDELGGLAP
jgi:hypothetical protein